MTQLLDAQRRSAQRAPSRVGGLWRFLPLLAVLVVAVALRHVTVANTDIAWQITIAEKLLAGQRLYVDIIEVNPPGPSYIYLLAVAAARALGLRPEVGIDAMVFGLVLGSLWFAGRILGRAGLLRDIAAPLLAALAAAILTILPAQTFGEREHLAVIAMLPFLAVLVVRAHGEAPGFTAATVAGVGAGLAVVFKPHLALGLGLMLVAAAWHARAWRNLFAPEAIALAVVGLAYVACVAAFFPLFFTDMLPLLADVYASMRRSPSEFLTLPLPWLWAALLFLLLVLKRKTLFGPTFGILLAGSVGFAITYVLQGKGWPYQSYPMLALPLIGLAIVAAERPAPSTDAPAGFRIGRLVPLAALIAVAGPVWSWMNLADDYSGLAEPIRRLKANPSMLVISSDFALGHPLVRHVGGAWVGRPGSLWITEGAERRLRDPTLDPATAARLSGYLARDAAALVEDIRRNRPDIIVVERRPDNRVAWAYGLPALASELQAYRLKSGGGDFAILRRTETAPAGH